MLSQLFSFSPGELEALWLSLKVGFWATALAVIPGIIVGWVLSRKDFRGKVLFDGLVHLPLVLPPVVTGYVLLVVLGNNGVVGRWLHETIGLSLAFNWKGAAVAAGVIGFPLMVRAIRLSMDHADVGLEEAAATLGASPFRVFVTITLPQALPGIATGMILAFARSLGEFGATIMFVSNIPGQTRTLPLALYTYTQMPGGELPAVRLVVLSIALSFVALIAGQILGQRKKSSARR